MAGEIYVEKQIDNKKATRRPSPTPKGFEKFRRIPSLASEKSNRKKTVRSSSITTTDTVANSCGSPSFMSSDENNKEKYSTESEFGKDAPLTSLRPISNKSTKSYMTVDDGFPKDNLRPVSTRTAKSFVMSRFSSNTTDANKQKFQDEELFSIANDEAEL
jgi:hypothetical protein